MINTPSAWAAIAVMGGLTLLLRAMPLLISRSVLKAPWMERLNQTLPLCVMVILVLNSLVPTTSAAASPSLPAQALALVAVAISYLPWRNALLSVVIGLAALSGFSQFL